MVKHNSDFFSKKAIIYLCVADNVFRVTVCWDFKFDPSHVVLGAEGPEAGLLDTLNALKLHHLEQKELEGHNVRGNTFELNSAMLKRVWTFICVP